MGAERQAVAPNVRAGGLAPPADPVSVAIPVRNGGSRLLEVLDAVRSQRLERPVELLVADSGSNDGSVAAAESYGATVFPVSPRDFSHGATRNMLFESAAGRHVAFLTQDAVPADEHWLARLLEGFEFAQDVALVFGPYRPRPEASPMVARELEDWFDSFAPDGRPRVDRGGPDPGVEHRRSTYFTDANGCVARWAWERVGFRPVAYAEDQLLARDMLRAGFSKAYHPRAAVIHSHDYTPMRRFQRSFDEWRALREIGLEPAPGKPGVVLLGVQREVRDDLDYARRRGPGPGATRLAGVVSRSIAHHLARFAGAALGSRAARLPAGLRRACSFEGRGDWAPAAMPGRPHGHG